MKIAVDENLPPRMARSLAALFDGMHEIIHLRDKFMGADDEVWIKVLSDEGRWIIFSGDRAIAKNKSQSNAFRNSRLIGFFFASGLTKSKITKQMERILARWDDIENVASTVRSGSMFEVPISGKLRTL